MRLQMNARIEIVSSASTGIAGAGFRSRVKTIAFRWPSDAADTVITGAAGAGCTATAGDAATCIVSGPTAAARRRPIIGAERRATVETPDTSVTVDALNRLR